MSPGHGTITAYQNTTAIAKRWNIFNPNTYSLVYNLDCNGVIDIIDIQSSTAAFGS